MRRISICDLVLIAIVVYLIAASIYRLFPIANMIASIFLMAATMLLFFKKIQKKDMFILFACIYYAISSAIFSDDIELFYTHTVHLICTVILIWEFANKRIIEEIGKSISKYKKLVLFAILMLAIMNIFLLLSGKFMSINTGTVVYSGLSNGGHAIAGISCLCIAMLMVTNLICGTSKTTLIIGILLNIIIIMASGSRVYCLLLLALLYIFYIEEFKKYKYYKIISALLLILVLVFVFNSNMFERTISTANNKSISTDKLEAFSSGRLIWWKHDIQEFWKTSFASKLFGSGNAFVLETNRRLYGLRIWAHNDFIQVLLSHGIVGLSVYLAIIISAIKKIARREKRMDIAAIVLSILILTCLNGFYIQQYAVLCVMFMMVFKVKQYSHLPDDYYVKGVQDAN